MLHRSLTPSITVTIGRHTRLYFAFVTTAPVELDSPATVTLHAATFSDVAGFAADPITHDEVRGRMPARLILVDAMELAWQRARCRGNHGEMQLGIREFAGRVAAVVWDDLDDHDVPS